MTKLLEPKELCASWQVSLRTARRMIQRSARKIRPVRRRGQVPQFTAEQARRIEAAHQRFLARSVRRAVQKRRAH